MAISSLNSPSSWSRRMWYSVDVYNFMKQTSIYPSLWTECSESKSKLITNHWDHRLLHLFWKYYNPIIFLCSRIIFESEKFCHKWDCQFGNKCGPLRIMSRWWNIKNWNGQKLIVVILNFEKQIALQIWCSNQWKFFL